MQEYVKSEKLPDFASAMASFYQQQNSTPSPADSGVMSPMTPLSNYTQGSTPEQAFITSPEHLNYAFETDYGNMQPTSEYSSDEGVVMPKTFYEAYSDHNWASVSTVGALEKNAILVQ